MKSKVLDRPMFKKGAAIDVENVGIMQGFKDMLGDLEMEDEYEGEEMDEAAQATGRTPDSPEILMNNLRGDMRSVDARVEELADLVGYGAAAETPASVLALLQPVLGAQQTMPAAPAAMMPPAGMPAEMMGAMPPAGPMPMPIDQGPMPAGGIGSLPAPTEAPIPMRNGGVVQRFSRGTSEEGATSQPGSFPPEMVQRSMTEVMNFINQQPAAVPNLAAETARRMPLYQQIIGGGDRGVTQAQMLFDIAQAGLNVAAGTDAEGRPLRGPQSVASRFASGFQKVPALVGARAGELQKEERQIKAVALSAAEKDIANIREQNAKLVESQRKVFTEVIKSSGISIWGKGDWEWAILNRPDLLKRSLEGKTTVKEENEIQSALSKLLTPIEETHTNPKDNRPYIVRRQITPPKFVQDYINLKQKGTAPAGTTTSGAPTSTAPAVSAPGAAPGPVSGGAAAPSAPVQIAGGTTITPVFPPNVQQTTTPSPSSGPVSLLEAANFGTGFFEVPLATIYSNPLIGNIASSFFPDTRKMSDAKNFIQNTKGAVSLALRENPRFTEGERKDIEVRLDIDPSMLTRTSGYISKLVSLDRFLAERETQQRNRSADKNIASNFQREAELKASDINYIRQLIGVMNTPIIETMDQFRKLPAGSSYILLNKGEYSYGRLR